jgi:hypothetical protein
MHALCRSLYPKVWSIEGQDKERIKRCETILGFVLHAEVRQDHDVRDQSLCKGFGLARVLCCAQGASL